MEVLSVVAACPTMVFLWRSMVTSVCDLGRETKARRLVACLGLMGCNQPTHVLPERKISDWWTFRGQLLPPGTKRHVNLTNILYRAFGLVAI